MVFALLRGTRRNQDSPITEIYTLTHPFYGGGHDPYNFQDYFRLWKESLSQAADREGAAAILQLCESMYDKTAIEFDKRLAVHADRKFGEHGVLFHRSSGIGIEGIFHPEIKRRLVDRQKTKVTGRGVYGFHCVESVVEAVCSAYNIPYENGSVDWLESPDSCGDAIGGYHTRELFPNTEERKKMQAKLKPGEYEVWIKEKLEKFKVIVKSDSWGWGNNLNLIRIKTYLGDYEFLKRKFGDLKLSQLKDGDFNDSEKAGRIAIAYHFLAYPFRIYGEEPRPIPDERFHVNPPFPKLDDPKEWEANREQVLKFKADLGEFLLERPLAENDTSKLMKIVERAIEKNVVVMSIY
jgi:hypothetical protein